MLSTITEAIKVKVLWKDFYVTYFTSYIDSVFVPMEFLREKRSSIQFGGSIYLLMYFS